MNAEQLRALQAPLKARYRQSPAEALATLRATGTVDFDRIAVRLTSRPDRPLDPGLHPMTGGDGSCACPAEMLLESLVGCAGVTLGAVCAAMGLPMAAAVVTAEGDLDFRGTMGISREVPVGMQNIRLQFQFDSTGTDEQLAKAVELAERYCVVAQSLASVTTSWQRL